jgi:hypothetical protein
MPRVDWRKLARVAAIGLASLVVAYALVANVLLSSGAIAHLVSEHPENLRLELASARTLWFGRVHVEGFDLRGRSAKVEWQLHIDATDVDLSLFALLRHHFQVAKVTATGVTFRVRFRLPADAMDPDRVARMPPIEGFAAVPILGIPPDTGDPKATPWIIDIHGVDARAVREVWIDAYRLVGAVRARGAFTLGAEHVAVGPATADVEGAALTTGVDPIATDVEGHLDARLDDVNLGGVVGAAVLRDLTMHSVLDGKMGGIRFVRAFVRDKGVTCQGGAGAFHSEVNVVRGLVSAGTTSQIDLEPATIAIDGHMIEGRARIDLTTTNDGVNATTWSKVDLALSKLAFTEPNAKGPALRCDALATSARVPQIDLADALVAISDLAYTWDAPRVELLDAHALDEAFAKDSPFHFERGTATVRTHGHGTLLDASAESKIESTVTMRVEGARVSAGAAGTVPMKASFVARTLDLSGTELALSDPALAGWWGQVKLGRATFHFDPASASLAITTTARDGRPFLSFYAAMMDTSLAAKTVLHVVPDPMIESMTANLEGAVRITASKGAVDVSALDVRGAASRLRGSLAKRGERMDGGLLIEAGPTALGISFAAGKTSLVLANAPQWFVASVEHGPGTQSQRDAAESASP